MAGKIRSRALSTVIGVAGLLFLLSLAAAPQSRAATTIGSDLAPDPLSEGWCIDACTAANTALPGGAQLTSPIDGVVVLWRVRYLNTSPTTARLRVISAGSGGSYTSVNSSATQPLPITGGTSVTLAYPTRQTIRAGQQLGIDFDSPANNVHMFTPIQTGASLARWEPQLADPGSGTPFVLDDYKELLLNADVEADCDSDGFGDETQDPDISSCSPPPPPPSGGTTPPPDGSGGGDPPPPPGGSDLPPPPGGSDPPLADTDPPETTITKGAPDTTDQSKVKFKFRSDEPGSTFQCKFDKAPWRACTSPRTVKRLDEGKHKFKVRAKDGAGNVDPTAAKDGFKVVD